jgi:hypothetical protein
VGKFQKPETSAMRRPLIASAVLLAVTVAVFPAVSHAQGQSEQGQLPMPPGGFKPPPPAPVKPYKPIAVTAPAAYGDPSFAAFRKQLAGVAEKKDRAALAKLVVTQGFFWMQEKDLADPHKPGIDSLAKALDLTGKDSPGWDVLGGYANEPSAASFPEHAGVICAPAGPGMDPKAFQALLEETQTSPVEWGYPNEDGVEVRGAAKPKAPVIDKLGMNLVRVLPDNESAEDGDMPQFLHVATPSGKAGYVAGDAISGLGGDEMCYVKDASGGWKITGYFGGSAE